MPDSRRIAVVYGVPLGAGGLAVQTANAIAALAQDGIEVHAIGPPSREWPRTGTAPRVFWHAASADLPAWSRWPIARAHQGRAVWLHDVRLGRSAAPLLDAIRPTLCYAFTGVALETLQWARLRGVPTILESPNGHIRNFRRVYEQEQRAWCKGRYLGHPTRSMVDRIEDEYALADRIRVSSEWSRESLVTGGVPASSITVLQQPVDLVRYRPRPAVVDRSTPLRVVFVGTLDLRKGFVYLLQAAKRMQGRITLELVGGTVSGCTRRLLQEHTHALAIRVAPGTADEAYHRAEISVLPTLEDGSPFAAAEAMACALPLVITDRCGAREWVDNGRTGWIVAGQDVDGLVNALETAISRRNDLREMGRAARLDTERRADASSCDRLVAKWAWETL